MSPRPANRRWGWWAAERWTPRSWGVRLERPDGLTVLRLIRTIDAGLPCVLVSRQTGRRLLQDALSLAAFSVVRSPVDDRVLADVANRLLERFLRRFGPT